MKRAFVLLGLLAAVLSSGVLLWSATKEPAEPSLTQPLRELLPTGEAFGWKYEDLPLGPTEALAEASQEMLNMSDWVYRRYTKGPDSFEVYIAYWEPGRMPARQMNEHTPDTCWVGNGWTIIKRNDNCKITERTKSGRFRTFEKSGTQIDVIFWHILDGETYYYGNGSLLTRLSKLLIDPFKHQLSMRNEQFLVRISTRKQLEYYFETEIFRKILEDITVTGVS